MEKARHFGKLEQYFSVLISSRGQVVALRLHLAVLPAGWVLEGCGFGQDVGGADFGLASMMIFGRAWAGRS